MHHRHKFILTSILFFCLFCGNCAFALFNSDLLALQSETAALRQGASAEEPNNSQHKIALLIGNSACEDQPLATLEGNSEGLKRPWVVNHLKEPVYLREQSE